MSIEHFASFCEILRRGLVTAAILVYRQQCKTYGRELTVTTTAGFLANSTVA